ncbi:MAG: serine hydrolase [Lachnospiraceae bacterium]|nr:serine hydrolase [Lachnospiraceae bacterium]
MYRVYLADTDELRDREVLSELLPYIGQKRRGETERIRTESGRLASYGAGILLSLALSEYRSKNEGKGYHTVSFVSLSKDDLSEDSLLKTERREGGKPYLSAFPEFHYNISHSANRVMLTVCDTETGCDVQQIGKHGLKLAKRCFSPAELAYYEAGTEDERARRFAKIWARKESFLKAVGVGIAADMTAFSTVDEKGEDCLMQSLDGGQWTVVSKERKDGFCYAVCYACIEDKNGKGDAMNFEKLTAYLDSLPNGYGIPSADCIVMQDHKQVYRHLVGTRDEKHTEPVLTTDQYLMFSMTKIQTMTAFMQLCEQGKISLDDPVSKYLPAYKNLTVREGDKVVPANKPLLMRHLCSMQSGLDYDLRRPGILETVSKYGEAATTRQIVDSFVKSPLLFHPGEHFLYSLSHDVVAAVIEVVSGMAFSEYLRKNIWEPVGMTRTYFYKKSIVEPNLNCQHIATEQGIVPMSGDACDYQISEAYESGGAGLVSCTGDYALLADALANGGVAATGKRILTPESIETIRTNQLSDVSRGDMFRTMGRPGYGYGIGMQILLEPELAGLDGKPSPETKGVFGWDGAAGSCTIMVPERKTALVFVIHVRNLGVAYSEIHPKLRDLIFEE